MGVRADPLDVAALGSPHRLAVLTVRLTDRGEPQWRADYQGMTAVTWSPLGLRCGPLDFTGGLTVAGVGPVRKSTEEYELFTRPRRRVKTEFRERTVTFRNEAGALLELDLRCGDGGVALRYRILRPAGDAGQPLLAGEERTGFALPPGDAWLLPYHRPGPYTPAYEDLFQAVPVGAAPGKCRGPGPADGWSFPALFRLASGKLWALLCESGVDETGCGSHLSAGESGLYRLRFPLAGEAKKSVPALGQSPAQPLSRLPWTSPWRAVILADDAGGIVTSTLPTDLAAPCEVADTSWIRPGRASWSWLSIPDRFDRDTFHTFLDFAAERGWEYSLLDAGWWNLPLQEMATEAQRKGVRLLLWGDSTEMYDPVER
ncbi:MAG: glycoside hydrolase family 97 N-terminal domain-containing protein, partial [Armatimonadetes bacterium]|nr:glycoside hydrolase family 97 N-terminal domain-containing protein [Armatimonadota bacterium]